MAEPGETSPWGKSKSTPGGAVETTEPPLPPGPPRARLPWPRPRQTGRSGADQPPLSNGVLSRGVKIVTLLRGRPMGTRRRNERVDPPYGLSDFRIAFLGLDFDAERP